MRTEVVNPPLHYGKAPSWLFKRMVSLVREIIVLSIDILRQTVLKARIGRKDKVEAIKRLLFFVPE
ncbi:MAG: DUF763 domain-containing protein [Deltaproteobacteria bacterium]|nr:DUF763 domain-containing protein [Deltaproteobacteria bacterium]